MGFLSYNSQHAQTAFENEVEALHGLASASAATAAWEGQVRLMYQRAIINAVARVRQQATAGMMTWQAAAVQLQQLRNELFEALRGRSSPVGRAVAEFLKREGPTLNALIGKYSQSLFGANAQFLSLNPAQQQKVYAEIVEAAARSRGSVNVMGQVLRIGGRSLFLLSFSISVYEVGTSPDPAKTATKEVAVLGAGLGGSVAGGAIAGLACGPGAPVCVALGAFVGGALFALSASHFLD